MISEQPEEYIDRRTSNRRRETWPITGTCSGTNREDYSDYVSSEQLTLV
jgi:hypothetical protein